MEKSICELFAGVGGFRVGFERLGSGWETRWFSQWEPSVRTQWAHRCYTSHFGDARDLNDEVHTNEDIASVEKGAIPDHNLLVAGFPCQDYSVAHTLGSAKGIEGKKGVLWWQIRDTLIAKAPPFCLFENVDRLLKSPAKQRGRDFGVILSCLEELGYSAEWRVVNAASYGAAQRRRRVFLFAYKNATRYGLEMGGYRPERVVEASGVMARAFPISGYEGVQEGRLEGDIVSVSERFAFPFQSAGVMRGGAIWTAKVTEREEGAVPLGEVLERCEDESFYITDPLRLAKWAYLKSGKRLARRSANGHQYFFSEGPVPFPDPCDRPGRTVLTSETTLSRTSHVVADPGTGRLRTLTPVEAERLQGFDDHWTDVGMPLRMRYFCMGNALVVPMVTRIGRVLDSVIAAE